MGAFNGKKILILGVANERSIAHSIAKTLHEEGAEVALTYANDALKGRVQSVATELGIDLVLPCDVQNDDEIHAVFDELGNRWGCLDGLVHSVAFADRGDLQGRFVDTSRRGFGLALEVSAYSLIALVRRAEKLMAVNGGSVVAMTYLGSERVIGNYRVMGVAKAALECAVKYLAAELGESDIRVNALSAGPVKTLASSGISQFKKLFGQFENRAPLKRNVALEDIAKAAMYLLGDLSSGVTGEVHHVDCGFNIMAI